MNEVYMFTQGDGYAHVPCSKQWLCMEPACGLFVLAASSEFLGVFPHRFQQQASVSFLHKETQLLQRRVVGRAAAFQGGDQLLVLRVVF